MALTILSNPPELAPAYNPIICSVSSDVTDSFTTGTARVINSIQSNNGFTQLNLGSVLAVGVGNYVLITDAPGVPSLLGVARVTESISGTQFVVDKVFVSNLSSAGEVFRYRKNYFLIVDIYIFITTNPSTPLLATTLRLRPRFNVGFCRWDIDFSSVIKDFNFAGFTIDDVLSSDIYPIDGTEMQANEKSFVKYGFELFENLE